MEGVLQPIARIKKLGVEFMDDLDLKSERSAGRRRPKTLARKVDLLVDTIPSENGKPFDYPAVRDAAQAQGCYVSREQWDSLKTGKEQTLPEGLLRAVAGVFGVSPEYLLEEDGRVSDRVEAELVLLRSMRHAGVRNFRACQSGQIDAAKLREIAGILDELD